jgi:hypothetical protein
VIELRLPVAPGEKAGAAITALPAQDSRGHRSEWKTSYIDREILAARDLHKTKHLHKYKLHQGAQSYQPTLQAKFLASTLLKNIHEWRIST